jgi:hypothetical protein
MTPEGGNVDAMIGLAQQDFKFYILNFKLEQ